ncbi:MAG: hypothetical protein GXO77_01790 [Calditrichaeota bacterium]|nr:hypothetical protein [Calditrichota bacterium]
MSLHLKRSWLLGGLVFVGILISALSFNLTYRDLHEKFFRQETVREAQYLGALLSTIFIADSSGTVAAENGRLQKLLTRLAANDTSLRFLAIYNSDKQSIWQTGKVNLKIDVGSLLRTSANNSQIRLLRLKSENPDGNQWLVVLRLNPEFANGPFLVFTKTAPDIGWFSLPFLKSVFPLLLNLTLLLILILFVTYHSFKKPLASVRNLAEHLNAGDYQYRVQYKGKDEFTDTFIRLNRSLERMGMINESYQKKEKNIQNLFEALEESILVLDSELRLNTFNPAVERLFKCPPSESFPDYFSRILEENMELREVIHRSRSMPEETLSNELMIWLTDDRELHVNVTIQKLAEGGFLLMFKDLTRVKELQNNLLRSMKFGIIANLVSSISHEIRNPLSAVGIHTEILSNRLKKEYPDLDPKLKRSLRIIQNEIKRIHRIHTQFFNLARKRDLKLSTLKPNALVEDVIQLVQHHALEQQINLRSTLDDSIDFIYGDADQIKQVLLNVVLNAFQAVEKGGDVHIKTSQDQNKVYIDIRDNGKGIPPEIGDRIFDLYFTTKKDGGGIGLALCKKIIEAHEGQIRYRSKVGQGTIFTISFPKKYQSRRDRIQTRLENLQ